MSCAAAARQRGSAAARQRSLFSQHASRMTRKDVRSRSEYARFALGVSHSESRVCVLGTSCAMSLRDSQEGDVRAARFVHGM